MRGEGDAAQTARRLEELAERAEKSGRPCFTGFLSPPEAEWAVAAGKRLRVRVLLNGGYEDAERRMACFLPDEAEAGPFPLIALALDWPHQSAPAHRDVLGSVMGLGVKRQCIGDIVLEAGRGYLFAERAMGGHIADALISAGRVKLRVSQMNGLPQLTLPEGAEVRDTVMTLRLDAVLAGGFGLSRAKAAALIEAGHVKLRHLPTERADARVQPGDTISARGFGRLVLEEAGTLTKKGRIPIRLMRYGEKRGR